MFCPPRGKLFLGRGDIAILHPHGGVRLGSGPDLRATVRGAHIDERNVDDERIGRRRMFGIRPKVANVGVNGLPLGRVGQSDV